MLFHAGVKAVFIDFDILAFECVLGKVERKTVSVVELEGDIAWEFFTAGDFFGLFLKHFKAAIESEFKALFLGFEGFDDQAFGAAKLRIGLAHFLQQRGEEFAHQRILCAQQVRMAHTAAHNPAQNITASFVRGHDAIGHQEGRAADVIGDDAVRCAHIAIGINARQVGGVFNKAAHNVDGIVIVRAHQGCGNALKAHAGIDALGGQIDARIGIDLLVLHEDIVPDLDKAVAIFFRGARRTAPDMITVIIENFSARAARAGITHAPEVIVGGDADDFFISQP